MLKIDKRMINRLEELERVSNEHGIPLFEALGLYSDFIRDRLHLSPQVNYITDEIWFLLYGLKNLCDEKGYRIKDVIYRASGDLWDNCDERYSSCLANDENAIKRLKRIRNGMLQRCTNPKDKHYPSYGGRGIKVYPEWEHNANAFIKWALNNGYENYLTLDRINPYGNYEPSNCRWANSYIQANNKRDSKKNKPLPIWFCGYKYSPKMLARLRHLIYEKLIFNLRTNGIVASVRNSMEKDCNSNILKRERRLYDDMDDDFKDMYNSLVRSCVENDVDIVVLLNCLLNDIKKAPIQADFRLKKDVQGA